MSGRLSPSVLSVTVDLVRQIALLRGRGARDLAIDFGLKPLWSAAGKGWVVDDQHAADLLAFAESKHFVTSYREIGAA